MVHGHGRGHGWCWPAKKESPGAGSNDKLSFYVWMAVAMAGAKIIFFITRVVRCQSRQVASAKLQKS